MKHVIENLWVMLPDAADAEQNRYKRQEMKRKNVKFSAAVPGGRTQNRTRVESEGEEEGDRGGEGGGVSSWMADHSRTAHNSVMSPIMTEDYEFVTTFFL